MQCLRVIDQRPDGSLILRDYDDNTYNVDNIVEAYRLDERLSGELAGLPVASSVSENIDDLFSRFSDEYKAFLQSQS